MGSAVAKIEVVEPWKVADVARFLAITPDVVRRKARRGEIPGWLVFGEYRFDASEIHSLRESWRILGFVPAPRPMANKNTQTCGKGATRSAKRDLRSLIIKHTSKPELKPT